MYINNQKAVKVTFPEVIDGFGHLSGKEPGGSPEVESERPTMHRTEPSLHKRSTLAGQRSSSWKPFPARGQSTVTGVAVVSLIVFIGSPLFTLIPLPFVHEPSVWHPVMAETRLPPL